MVSLPRIVHLMGSSSLRSCRGRLQMFLENCILSCRQTPSSRQASSVRSRAWSQVSSSQTPGFSLFCKLPIPSEGREAQEADD